MHAKKYSIIYINNFIIYIYIYATFYVNKFPTYNNLLNNRLKISLLFNKVIHLIPGKKATTVYEKLKNALGIKRFVKGKKIYLSTEGFSRALKSAS